MLHDEIPYARPLKTELNLLFAKCHYYFDILQRNSVIKEPNSISCVLKFMRMLKGILIHKFIILLLFFIINNSRHKRVERRVSWIPEIQQDYCHNRDSTRLLRFCHACFIYMFVSFLSPNYLKADHRLQCFLMHILLLSTIHFWLDMVSLYIFFYERGTFCFVF